MVNNQLDSRDVNTWTDAEISDVLDTLAHDVNNIIQSVQGNAQLAQMLLHREGEVSPEVVERIMNVTIKRMSDLTVLMQNTRQHSHSLRSKGHAEV